MFFAQGLHGVQGVSKILIHQERLHSKGDEHSAWTHKSLNALTTKQVAVELMTSGTDDQWY